MTDFDIQVSRVQRVASLLYQAMQHINRKRHVSLALMTNFRIRVRLHNLWQRVHGLSYHERKRNENKER